jgi:hypothetical protein
MCKNNPKSIKSMGFFLDKNDPKCMFFSSTKIIENN